MPYLLQVRIRFIPTRCAPFPPNRNATSTAHRWSRLARQSGARLLCKLLDDEEDGDNVIYRVTYRSAALTLHIALLRDDAYGRSNVVTTESR